ncbi:glycosyltransferase family 2 protein [Pseudonocardia sp. RS010]|uniref:glycosyltransferase family 2 protein n=1 Tax=Pseudonocardia sp. RS010 TaxID=3385979 RepID=UPI0039A32C90
MLGIVIVYYNQPQLIRQTIKLLAEDESIPEHRIVVVDNNSDLPCPRDLASTTVKIHRASINGGYAFAVNTGIEYLLETTPTEIDTILVATHEVLFAPNCVSELYTALQFLPSHCVVGPAMHEGHLDGPIWSFGGYFTRAGRALHSSVDEGSATVPAAWIDGAAMMFSLESWRQVGGLDEGYFLYFEEIDFCQRLASIGGTVSCIGSARAAQSMGDQTPRLKFRNGIYYHWRWSRRRTLLTWIAAETVRLIIRHPSRVAQALDGARLGLDWVKNAKGGQL